MQEDGPLRAAPEGSRVNRQIKLPQEISEKRCFRCRKLGHWERPLRELASRALAALVPTQPQLFAEDVLDRLLPMCLYGCLEVRPHSFVHLKHVMSVRQPLRAVQGHSGDFLDRLLPMCLHGCLVVRPYSFVPLKQIMRALVPLVL